MPEKLVDHMGLSFPLSLQCDWKVIFYIFVWMTMWWHSKGVILAVAHIKCNPFLEENMFILSNKTEI